LEGRKTTEINPPDNPAIIAVSFAAITSKMMWSAVQRIGKGSQRYGLSYLAPATTAWILSSDRQ